MSSSRRSGEVDAAQEQLLQERLQILLERLRWSYVALWTLNSHTRLLEWKRGYYFQVETTTSQPRLAWYAQHFYTLYRLCSFAPGTGFVGRANLEGRHMWLSGDTICQNAGSLEQSQFLSYAKIKTVMCIPWLDSVLELGTTNFVGENFHLMDQIQQVLCHDLLSVPWLQEAADHHPGFAAGHYTTNASHAPAAALQHHQAAQSSLTESLQLPDPAQLNQPGNSSFQSKFDINPSDQVWRSDMLFMQEQDSLPDLTAAWRAVEVEDNQNRHKNTNAAQHEYSTSYGLMNSSTHCQARDHYGSCSTSSFAGTTTYAAVTASSSTSGSSHGDQYSNSSSATRPAASSVSPEVLHQQSMQALSPPISLSSTPDRTSSTVRLPQGQLHPQDAAYNVKHELHATAGARNQNNSTLRRATSCSDQFEFQKALSLFEAQEMQDQWRQQGLNAVSETADPNIMEIDDQSANVSFHSWQLGHDPILSTSLSNQSNINALRKQVCKIPRASQLLRRHSLSSPMEVLKEVGTYQQEAANSNLVKSSEQDYFQIQANQPAARPADVQMNNKPNSRGRPRVASSSGALEAQLAAGHGEAAMNHMLAERRRRVRQKENFATLRRLVPIISKADKASTLVDAIVYLKDLQNTIVEMKANKDDMVQRCEELASKCMELEEQNKELEAILSKHRARGGVVHLNHLN